jgi:two-component system sensor histidine kinase UhpB
LGIIPEKLFSALHLLRYNTAHPLWNIMSLQLRLLGAIAALLALALLCGGTFLFLHARTIAAIEVRTAFQGAENSVRETLKSDVEHTVTLRQVVASFEGQRHVRAALMNEDGRVIVKSEIGYLANPAPRWFSSLMMLPQMSAQIHINLQQYPCVVQLTSDPRSELGEVWTHVRDAFVTMLLLCGATMAVIWLAVAYTLHFFRRFQTGLLAVADGSYGTRLDTRGPPEFAAIASGFNHMAERLAAFSDSNRRLQQQIQSVQEEERADIARDLHDEVGPYLFAIQVDANVVAKIAAPQASELGSAIRNAALHAQQHVKEILRQLRPVKSLDFGLETAISDLVAFWSCRYPTIHFELAVAIGPSHDRRSEEVAYRIVQESLSNAVRHGAPQLIRIVVTAEKDHLLVCIEDDGGGLRSDLQAGMSLGHFGLVGMEERVQALKGHFTIEGLDGRGVRIRALLPKMREVEPA